MGRVMNDAERVHEVVRLTGKRRRELFRIRMNEADAVAYAETPGAFTGDVERLRREVDGRDCGTGTGEVHRVGTDAASHFEDALPSPA